MRQNYLIVVTDERMLCTVYNMISHFVGLEFVRGSLDNNSAYISCKSFTVDIIIEKDELRTIGRRVDGYYYLGSNTEFENVHLKHLLK